MKLEYGFYSIDQQLYKYIFIVKDSISLFGDTGISVAKQKHPLRKTLILEHFISKKLLWAQLSGSQHRMGI